MKPANSILSGYGTTVFEVMSALANEHKAVNLGQGFPDGNGPDDVRAMAHTALDDRPNQYPPMFGVPELRQAVAKHNRRFYGLDIDWQTETLVTSGATEALAAAHFGLIEPGDEVVLIEPLYDCYLPIIRRAGAVPRLVRIEPPDWSLPEADLRAAFSGPHQAGADQHADEPGREGVHPRGTRLHRRPVPGARRLLRRRRGLRASGVRRPAPRHHDGPARDARAHGAHRQRGQDLLAHRLEGRLHHGAAGADDADRQDAPVSDLHHAAQPAARQRPTGWRRTTGYFTGLARGLQRSRDRFRAGLEAIGFETVECHGTYFITVDIRSVGFNGDDVDFCRTLTTEAGVAAVPVSAFYQNDPPRHFARFSFCKEDATLDEALKRMRAWLGR